MEWLKKILQSKRSGFFRFTKTGDPSKLSDEHLRRMSKTLDSSTPAFRKEVISGTIATKPNEIAKKKKKKPPLRKSLVTGELPVVRKKTLLG